MKSKISQTLLLKSVFKKDILVDNIKDIIFGHHKAVGGAGGS